MSVTLPALERSEEGHSVIPSPCHLVTLSPHHLVALSRLIAVLLLLAFAAQAAGNLYDQSPVVDEPTHIARAQAYWRTGDFRLQRGHPPLIHALSGLALQLEPGLPSPAELPGWANTDRMSVARHFLWDAGRPSDRIIFLARLPVLMLTLIMGAALFRWARQRLGSTGALAALFLFAFDPNLLAHSVLITTDMVATVFIFIACYTLDQWMTKIQRGVWSLVAGRWSALAGAAIGLALASKAVAVILGPVVIIVAGLVLWRTRAWKATLGALIVMALAIALTLGLIYRFEFGARQPGTMPIPLPSFWNSLLAIEQHNQAGHPAFLFGQISPQGWWYYFIVAFLLKTPLPVLVLFIMSIAYCVLRIPYYAVRNTQCDSIAPVWVILLATCFFASLQISINVGYRHVLPLAPFILLVAASGAQYALRNTHYALRITLTGHALRFTFYALLTWHIVAAFAIYPCHLAYFNELIGGPASGYRALVDSNLDWGQDVRRLAQYLQANNIAPPYLTLFSGSPPEYYGIQSRPLPGPYQPPTAFDFHRLQPAPGVYVIGASNLQGLRLDDPDTYDFFRRQPPIAQVGYSLFVYRVAEKAAAEKWAAICHTIDGPMDGKGAQAAFGQDNLRKIFFDCLSGWIYPHDGPGWYVVPLRDNRPALAAQFLLDAPEIFFERGYAGQDAYRVHHFDPAALKAQLATLNKPPAQAQVGAATMLGYTLNQPTVQRGQTAQLVTFWQANVTGKPMLSILAHLGGPSGLIATGDGLGVPAETWLPGDVIAQMHTFQIPPDTPPGEYTLYAGMYSIVSGAREPVSLNGEPVPDNRLPMATLRVTE